MRKNHEGKVQKQILSQGEIRLHIISSAMFGTLDEYSQTLPDESFKSVISPCEYSLTSVNLT